jgi:hypothetical protein
MKKIKEMYIIYTHPSYNYGKTNLPFLDWIYTQCYSNNIGIVGKIWFTQWRFDCLFRILSLRKRYDKEILYL